MKGQYLSNTILSKVSPQLSLHVWRNLSSVSVAVDEMSSKRSRQLPYKNRFTSTTHRPSF